MYAEILNVTQDKAYYVEGPLEDLHGVVMTPGISPTELGDDSGICLHRVTPVLHRLTDIEPGDSFQVRLFTMDPESRILTNGFYYVGSTGLTGTVGRKNSTSKGFLANASLRLLRRVQDARAVVAPTPLNRQPHSRGKDH